MRSPLIAAWFVLCSCGQAPTTPSPKTEPAEKSCPPVAECKAKEPKEGEPLVISSRPQHCSADTSELIECDDFNGDGCTEARHIQCGGPNSCEVKNMAEASCKAKLDKDGKEIARVSVGYITPGKEFGEGFVDGDTIPVDKATKKVKAVMRTYGYLIPPIKLRVKLKNSAGVESDEAEIDKVELKAGSDGLMYAAVEIDASKFLGEKEVDGQFIIEDTNGSLRITLPKQTVKEEP